MCGVGSGVFGVIAVGLVVGGVGIRRISVFSVVGVPCPRDIVVRSGGRFRHRGCGWVDVNLVAIDRVEVLVMRLDFAV